MADPQAQKLRGEARALRLLALLLETEVPILDALMAAKCGDQNAEFAFARVATEIREGSNFDQALAASRYFSPFVPTAVKALDASDEVTIAEQAMIFRGCSHALDGMARMLEAGADMRDIKRAAFYRLWGALFEAQAPITNGILALKGVGYLADQQLDNIVEMIRKGESLADSLRTNGVPEDEYSYIDSGEEVGDMPSTCLRLGIILEKRATPAALGISPETAASNGSVVMALDMLARFLDAGLPVMRTLQILAITAPPQMRDGFKKMSDAIEAGKPMSEAMATLPGMFTFAAIELMKVGERYVAKTKSTTPIAFAIRQFADYSAYALLGIEGL